MYNKILVMGLPGSGKTTLATLLAQRLGAVHFNADEVRTQIHKDLGFSHADRIEHARRMGWLCDQVTKTGSYAIADFICPTPETRAAFGDALVVWMDRIKEGRYEDTNRMFVPPEDYHFRVTVDGSPESWCEKIVNRIRPAFDPMKPTALFIGRWQPFHDGHKALIEEGLRRVGQVCIAVRNTHGTDSKNPFPFEEVRQRIQDALVAHVGRFTIVQLPNISNVYYGRDVGYSIEELVLPPAVRAISATEVRSRIGM